MFPLSNSFLAIIMGHRLLLFEFVEVFGIHLSDMFMKNVDSIPMKDMFEFSDNYNLAQTKDLKKSRALKSACANSFCIRAVIGWNDLPVDTVNPETILRFKTSYDRNIGN